MSFMFTGLDIEWAARDRNAPCFSLKCSVLMGFALFFFVCTFSNSFYCTIFCLLPHVVLSPKIHLCIAISFVKKMELIDKERPVLRHGNFSCWRLSLVKQEELLRKICIKPHVTWNCHYLVIDDDILPNWLAFYLPCKPFWCELNTRVVLIQWCLLQ